MSQGLPGPGDDLADRAAKVVRAETEMVPSVALVLGSGLAAAVGPSVEEVAGFAYTDLPGFPGTAVPGHAGRLTLGHLAGVPVAVFSGRFHLYEGHSPDVPALLPRLGHALGARTLIVTAAAGALTAGLAGGTIVILSDHLNLMGTTPLRGWRTPDGTPAFVNAQAVYDPDLRALALARAAELGIAAVPAVYAAMAGPAYETPAEVAFLAAAGATVVGMSVVPETMVARALGMRVLGLCSLTNALGEQVSHEQVVRVSNETAEAVGRLLADVLPRMEGVTDV